MQVTPVTPVEGSPDATRQRYPDAPQTRQNAVKRAAPVFSPASVTLELYGAPHAFGHIPQYGFFSEKV